MRRIQEAQRKAAAYQRYRNQIVVETDGTDEESFRESARSNAQDGSDREEPDNNSYSRGVVRAHYRRTFLVRQP